MNMIIKMPEWDHRIMEYLFQVGLKPEPDSRKFVGDALEVITGVNFFQKLIDNPADVVYREAGFPVTDWKHAHRGDPCLVSPDRHGICMGDHALTTSVNGLERIRMRLVTSVWTIPYD